MNDLTKKEAIEKWLESHPEKTELDWLLEERCTTKVQREALKELLECCDACGVKYEIAHHVDLEEEYSELLATDTVVQDFLTMTKQYPQEKYRLNTYQQFIAKQFDEVGIEYSQHHVFDLYFPQIGWFINLGTEIENAISNPWSLQIMPNESRRNNISRPTFSGKIASRFYNHLNSHYSIPRSERIQDPEVRYRYYYYFLPWNKEIHSEASKINFESPKLPGTFDNLKPGTVNEFWRELFKDHFNEMKAFRKERYLNTHTDMMGKRADMLHSLVIGILQKDFETKKSISEISEHRLHKLLETVDNELSLFHPEFGEIHHMRD